MQPQQTHISITWHRSELKGRQGQLPVLSRYPELLTSFSAMPRLCSRTASSSRAACPLIGKHNVITTQGRDDGEPAARFAFQNCTVTSNEDLQGAETFLGWLPCNLMCWLRNQKMGKRRVRKRQELLQWEQNNTYVAVIKINKPTKQRNYKLGVKSRSPQNKGITNLVQRKAKK
jgi:hypothetical protein